MEWKTKAQLDELLIDRMAAFQKIGIETFATVESFLLHHDGTILAWTMRYSPSQWYWKQYDDKPARGPFDTEAAAKLAARIQCYNPSL